MKKIFLLSLMLAIVIPLPMASGEESTEPNQTSNAFYVENLSEENLIAEEQALEASKKNKIKFDLTDLKVEGSQVSLNVRMDDTKPLGFSGTLKKTYASPDKIIVGSLVENTGAYEVIHFSVNKSSSDFASVIGKSYDSETINLYLQSPGTRNFIFAEIQVPENIKNNLEAVFNNVDKLDKFENQELFWYQKVVNPISISQSETPVEPGGFTTQAVMKNVKTQKNFVLRYSFGGLDQADLVWVEHTLEYPGDVQNNKLTAFVKILRGYTWDYTNNRKLSDQTTAEVNNMRVALGITQGNFTNLSLSGIYYKAPKLSFALSFSQAIFAGVGLDVNYESGGTITSFPVRVDKTQFAVQLPSNLSLSRLSDQMVLTSEFNNGRGGRVYGKFSYNIGNGYASDSGVSNVVVNLP